MSKRILIIDDEQELSDMTKLRLEANGYEVLCAYDGLAGLDMVKKEMPDLILLDVNMPKMDGFQVCRLLKFDAKFKSIPIIMLTARGTTDDIEIGGQIRADAYMTKPFDSQELLDKIKELLESA